MLPARAENADSTPQNHTAVQAQADAVPGEVLVKLEPSVSAAAEQSINKQVGAQKLEDVKGLKVERVRLSKGISVEEAVEKYENLPGVEYAEPNYRYHKLATPNDTRFGSGEQWSLPKIKAPEAWDITTGSDVVVAVVDSGVNYNHEDLTDKVIKGYDFVNNDADPMDDDEDSHGTHVAGIIAATTNNGAGIAGVSWGAKVLAVKVLDNTGTGFVSRIAQGIKYAADSGARIINLSFGGYSPSSTMADAISYAQGKGCVVIAAAGNEYSYNVCYPAAYQNVVGVAATNSSDNSAWFSNYGWYIDVTAPGDNILSTVNSGYAQDRGTSMSAPHVSGIAALILSCYPGLTGNQVARLLQETACDDHWRYGYDHVFGYGYVDAEKAVKTYITSAEENEGAFTGTWDTTASSYASGGQLRIFSHVGDSVSYSFNGTGVTWVARKGIASGIARVFIDGTPVKDADIQLAGDPGGCYSGVDLYDDLFDFYSTDTVRFPDDTFTVTDNDYQRPVYTKNGLTSGNHTITIKATGLKDPNSDGDEVSVDVFDVVLLDTTKPSIPTGVSAATRNTGVMLSWNAATDNAGVAGYKIERSSTGGDPWTQIVIATPTSFLDTSIVANTRYFYQVKAYDAAGNDSTPSNSVNAIIDTLPPNPPVYLSASAKGNSVTLYWAGASDNVGVTSYVVERSTNKRTFWPVTQVPSTVFTNTGLKAKTIYYYRVRAKDAVGGISGASRIVSVKTGSSKLKSRVKKKSTSSKSSSKKRVSTKTKKKRR